MAKTEISLDLHEEGSYMLLDSADILNYVADTTAKEAEFVLYIENWCKYLNRTVLDNDEMAFCNEELARLGGWIDGYETAKGYVSTKKYDAKASSHVAIAAGKYMVRLAKPFKI